MDEFRSDASALRQITKDLKAAQPAMVRAVRRAVREEGRKVAGIARTSAGRWSNRIPDTIKVLNSGLIAVVIRAGGDPAPHAVPYENKGQRGKFRHPLNYPNQGNKQHWVSQNARPFLHPAAVNRLEEIRRAIVEAAMAALEEKIREEKHEARISAGETDY